MHSVFSLRKHFWAKILIFHEICREIVGDEQIESSFDFSEASIMQNTSDQTLSKITIFVETCFLSGKIKCIIVTISHRIGISHPRKPFVKLCGKSISRSKGCFLMGKSAVTNTNTNGIRNRNTDQYHWYWYCYIHMGTPVQYI